MDRNRRRNVMRWLKRALLFVLVAGGGFVLIRSLAPKPIPVDLTEVAEGRLVVTVDEDGRARVKDRYVVSAPLGGQLARITLEPGDDVARGDVVARIVPMAAPLLDARSRSSAEARVAAALSMTKQAAAQVERARVAFRFAETEAGRLERLAADGVISPQELDQARMKRRTAASDFDSARFAEQVARHDLETARAALGRLSGDSAGPTEQVEVTAPVGGRVLTVLRESEGAVTAGTPLLEVGDPAALEIVVDVLTQDAVEIVPGAAVEIDRWGGPPLAARVRRVEPSAFTRLSALGVEEQRVNVIADLTEAAPDHALGDGYRVEARITVWQSDEALSVPASSLFRQAEGWAVFRAKNAVVEEVPVKIGRRTGRRVQITSGLAPGERVVVHPSDDVHAGVKVVARPQ